MNNFITIWATCTVLITALLYTAHQKQSFVDIKPVNLTELFPTLDTIYHEYEFINIQVLVDNRAELYKLFSNVNFYQRNLYADMDKFNLHEIVRDNIAIFQTLITNRSFAIVSRNNTLISY